MSHDLVVATRRRPTGRLIRSVVEGGGLSMQGRFGADRALVVIGGPGSNSDRTIEVDGPDRAETEDLGPAIIHRYPDARWLLSIRVPGSLHDGVDDWILAFAASVAAAGEGVVFDSTAEAIRWPERPVSAYPDLPATAGRRPASSSHRSVRSGTRAAGPADGAILRLQLTSLRDRVPLDAAARLIGVLRAEVPAAVPARFGLHEPYPHRLDRDGDAAFAGDWASCLERYGFLTWTSTLLDAVGVLWAGGGEGRLPPMVVLELPMDAGRAPLDPGRADEVVGLMVSIAGVLGAIHGAAWLERGYTVEDRELLASAQTRTLRLRRSMGWAGLPLERPWFTWLGRPYASELPAADRGAWSEVNGGLVHRTHAVAVDLDTSAAKPPPVPAAWCQVERVVDVIDPLTGDPRNIRRLDAADDLVGLARLSW